MMMGRPWVPPEQAKRPLKGDRVRRTHWISDPELFADVIDEMVDRLGSVAAVAEVLGTSRKTVWQFRARRTLTVRRLTYVRICEHAKLGELTGVLLSVDSDLGDPAAAQRRSARQLARLFDQARKPPLRRLLDKLRSRSATVPKKKRK